MHRLVTKQWEMYHTIGDYICILHCDSVLRIWNAFDFGLSCQLDFVILRISLLFSSWFVLPYKLVK